MRAGGEPGQLQLQPMPKTRRATVESTISLARAVLETSVDASARRLAILDAERAALKAERVRVNNCIKNERRKRARLLRKAEGLTVNELFETAVRKLIAIGAAPARRQ